MALASHSPDSFSPGAWLTAEAHSPHAVLTTQQTKVLDKLSADHGVGTDKLMGRAGAAVAEEIKKRYSRRPVVVLAGTGNNGGDGLVAAAELKLAGWPVSVALLSGREELMGDAAAALRRWDGPVALLNPSVLEGAELIVDALFGAGLSRAISPELAKIFALIEKRRIPVVAVDIPSGVEGNTGQVLGAAVRAEVTVTLARKKPGHLLLPGRAYCGALVVADIGVPAAAYEVVQPNLYENAPPLWLSQLPRPAWPDHKYSRGCAFVAGGLLTGAGRLAARGAQRAGAGIVHVFAPEAAAEIYDLALTSCIIRTGDFAKALAEPRLSAALIGPGYGVGKLARLHVAELLKRGKPTVLDADALTSFADQPAEFLGLLHADCVLTPHEGEFSKLFAFTGDNLRRASLAAVATGAVVVLKGSATVVAAPDGTCLINTNAPPDLATAGSGDVLAGLITGLLAQGMRPLPAAAAGVWLHGEAGRRFGPGLIAEDLEVQLPAILAGLRSA